MEVICGIYKITSPSGKIYIGSSGNIMERIRFYKIMNCKNQRVLFNSLSKYGWDAHLFEIIEKCDEEDLYCRERYWQDFYNVLGKNGLNSILVQCGDIRTVVSEETRKKQSISGKNKKLSEEHKNKIRLNHASKKEGFTSWLKGLPKELHPSFGKKHTEERILKAVESRRKSRKLDCDNPLIKSVINFKTLETCCSVRMLSELIKVNLSYLKSMLVGNDYNKTDWCYKEDFENGRYKSMLPPENKYPGKPVICRDTCKTWHSISACARDLNLPTTKLTSMLDPKRKDCPNITSILYLKDYDNQINK